MADTIEINDKGLKKLLKAFDNIPLVKVGVLRGHTKRFDKKDGETNAEIGAKHEYGLDGMPVRSFLRMPITLKLQKALRDSGAFTEEALAEVIRAGSLSLYMEKIGAVAEDVVAGAFATGGYGQWKPSNMKYKENLQTLVETHQLRDSISSEVTK